MIATQLSLEEGLRLRDQGLARVEAKYSYVHEARKLAVSLARRDGDVDTDRIQAILPRPADVSPNALGAVLKPPLFYYAGPTRSARKEARGRFIGVWKLNHE